MARKIVWEFALKDSLSNPANNGARALGKMRVSLQLAGDAADKLAGQQNKAAHSSESLATHLHSVLGVGEKLGHIALSAAEGIGELGFSFGEAAIEAASFKETTLVGLETIMGSAEDAQKVLRDTVRLSYNLPLEPRAAVEAVTQLALSGIPKEDLAHLTIAASDVKAFNPGRGDEAMKLFLRQVGDIQAVGLNARHLLALAQETHIPEDKIVANLSKFSGVKAPAKAHGEALAKFLEAIPKDTAITAITQTIADLQGGQLGTISNKLSKTVEGMTDTLKGRPLELMMDLDTQPAYKEYKGFLGNAVKLTDPGSPFGSKIRKAITEIFGGTFHAAFGDLSGDAGMKNLESAFDKVLRVGQVVGLGFQGGIEFAKAFGSELLGDVDNLFGKDGSLDPKRVKSITDSFREMGKEVGVAVKGVVELASATKGLIDKLADNGNWGDRLAKKRLKDAGLDERAFDPTRPWLGGTVPSWYKPKGLTQGMGVSPVSPLRPPGADDIDRVAGTRPASGPGSSGAVIMRGGDVNVNVDARGSTPGSAEAIGSKLERVVPNATAKANRNLTLKSSTP